MKNKTEEHLIIENIEDLLSQFNNNHNTNDKLLLEFTNLVDNYKKLTNKYDIIQESMNTYLSRNDNLQNLTKKKVFENASSIIELKEKYNQEINIYKETISKLKEEININNKKIRKLNDELTNSKKEVDYLKDINEELESKIKNLEEFNIPFENILESEIVKSKSTKEPLILAIIGIYDFANVRDKIKKFTTIDNFILGVFRYLVNNLRKYDTVKFIEVEMFYILMPNTSAEEAADTLEKFNKERIIDQNSISLSSGYTLLNKKDTVDSIIDRTSHAYNESIKDSRHSLIVRR